MSTQMIPHREQLFGALGNIIKNCPQLTLDDCLAMLRASVASQGVRDTATWRKRQHQVEQFIEDFQLESRARR